MECKLEERVRESFSSPSGFQAQALRLPKIGIDTRRPSTNFKTTVARSRWYSPIARFHRLHYAPSEEVMGVLRDITLPRSVRVMAHDGRSAPSQATA